MWNQNNGNGQGYGQQPQQGYQQQYGGQQDVYDRLNSARDVGGAKFPFIEDGTHRLALVTLEEFMHSTDGQCARAILKVIASNKHAPGSFVVKIWKLVKPPKFNGQNSDGEFFVDFCRKLKGAPAGYAMGGDIRVLMKERPADQLARGTVIECVGVPNQKRTWVNIYWNTIPQSPQDIVAMRQQLEREGIPSTGGAAQQMPQQMQGQQPMQPQYPQQQPQYPQQQQAPMQAPQQGYVQQQAVPALNPQNFGGQPAQAPAGVPQGGFLGNVPPQGNGPQGGNGGPTW